MQKEVCKETQKYIMLMKKIIHKRDKDTKLIKVNINQHGYQLKAKKNKETIILEMFHFNHLFLETIIKFRKDLNNIVYLCREEQNNNKYLITNKLITIFIININKTNNNNNNKTLIFRV